MDGLWLQTDYWDEQGVRRKKPHWLFESFERYKRWLSKEFTKYKVAGLLVYIGPEALCLWRDGLRLYQDGGPVLPPYPG